jgi:1-acyl-sn-glycerol-3-phosphate acyltransferase
MDKITEKKLYSKIYKKNGEVKEDKVPFLYRVGYVILPKLYGWLYGLKFIGAENIPEKGAFILASSHVTAHDPLFLGCAKLRSMHFMAKVELFKNKLLSWIITYAGAFPVERGTGGGDALQYAYDLLNNGRMVTVFIEGTRSKDGQLGKPKTGISLLAYKTKVPVIPCAIVGEDGGLPRKHGKMRVVFGKPIPFEELGIEAEGSMYFRRGAKKIMGEITALRETAIEDMK